MRLLMYSAFLYISITLAYANNLSHASNLRFGYCDRPISYNGFTGATNSIAGGMQSVGTEVVTANTKTNAKNSDISSNIFIGNLVRVKAHKKHSNHGLTNHNNSYINNSFNAEDSIIRYGAYSIKQSVHQPLLDNSANNMSNQAIKSGVAGVDNSYIIGANNTNNSNNDAMLSKFGGDNNTSNSMFSDVYTSASLDALELATTKLQNAQRNKQFLLPISPDNDVDIKLNQHRFELYLRY